MAPPADNGDRAPVVRSSVCVTSPPHLVGDTEFFVPEAGRGGRRAIRPGEHLEPGHPLALAHPGCFTPSAEPPDTWPIGMLSIEARKRQQAERLALASSPARRISFVCIRCGAEAAHSVIVLDRPTELGLISELSGLDDGDPDSRAESWRINETFAARARVVDEQERELVEAEAAWRASHQQCSPSTPPLPEPEIPKRTPLLYRLPGVRTLK